MPNHGEQPNLPPIDCVSTLLSNIEEIKKREADQPLRYYRGLNKDTYDLMPSVMRKENHRKKEGEMLRDLMTRQPDEFSRFPSALDRWMLAQHHGLYTRFLDISTNPLVGLHFACGEPKDDGSKKEDDGLLYVFATTRECVKPYDSDSVSIIANFARLRRDERKAILKKTKKFLSKRGAFVDHRQWIMSNDGEDIEEVRDYAEYMDRSLRPENEARGRYFDMGRLWTFIKQEKPYFVEGLIKPRDLFRIFIVQPRQLFPRVIAQSGAFLVSAHHKRFDFESKEKHDRNSRYGPNDNDVPYNYYRLRVKAKSKPSIREELQSLNISEETLFPELVKSADTIVKETERRNNAPHAKIPGGTPWIST